MRTPSNSCPPRLAPRSLSLPRAKASVSGMNYIGMTLRNHSPGCSQANHHLQDNRFLG